MSTVLTFQQAAKSIRIAFGDAFRPVTYAVISSPDYLVETGTVTNGVVPKYEFPALFSRFTHYHHVALGIPVDDWKLTFATLDAPDLVPRVGHMVKNSGLGVWEVVRVMGDPVDALRMMQIRRSRKLFP